MDVFDLRGVLRLDTKDYEKGLEDASEKSHSFGGKVASGLGKAAKVGGAALAGATAAAGAFYKSAINESIKYESAFTGVMKTVDETATTSYEDISKAIKQMSTETASSKEDIAGVAEVAGQLGVSADDITKFTKTIVELGDTTNLSAEEAAMSLAQFNNITGEGNDNIDRIGASIVDLGNNFATTETDIVNMAQRLAGAGKMFNISSQDILGISTAMSSVGIKAEAGGTAMTQVFTKIDKAANGVGKKAGPALEAFSKMAGMSAEEFRKAWKEKPTEAFVSIVKGMEQFKAAGGNTVALLDQMGINGIREADSMKRLLGSSDLLTKALETSNTAYEQNTALTAEAEKRYGTTESKINQMKESVGNLKLALVDGLAPAFSTATTQGVDAINGLSEAFQTGGMDGFMTKLGDVFTNVIQKLVEKIPNAINTGSKLLMSLIQGITKNIPQLTKAAKEIVTNLVSAVKNAAPELLKAGIQLFMEVSKAITEVLPEILPQVVDLVIQLAQELINNAPQILQAGLDMFLSLVDSLMAAIPVIIDALPELITSLVNALLDAIPIIIQAGIKLLTSLVQNLPTIIQHIVEAIPKIITGVVDAVLTHIPDIIQAGFELITSLIGDLPNIILTIVGAIPQIIGGIVSNLLSEETIKKIFDAGFKLIGNLFEGIVSIIGDIPNLLGGLLDEILKIFTDPVGFLSDMLDAGEGIINMLWEGMKKIFPHLTAWLEEQAEWMQNILDSIGIGMNEAHAKAETEKNRQANIEKERQYAQKKDIYYDESTRSYDRTRNYDGSYKKGKKSSVSSTDSRYKNNTAKVTAEDTVKPKTKTKTKTTKTKVTKAKKGAQRVRKASTENVQEVESTKTTERVDLQQALDEYTSRIENALNNQDTKIVLNDREVGRAVRAYA